MPQNNTIRRLVNSIKKIAWVVSAAIFIVMVSFFVVLLSGQPEPSMANAFEMILGFGFYAFAIFLLILVLEHYKEIIKGEYTKLFEIWNQANKMSEIALYALIVFVIGIIGFSALSGSPFMRMVCNIATWAIYAVVFLMLIRAILKMPNRKK